MKHRGPALVSAFGLTIFAFVASLGAVDPGVSLIGFGLVPGTDLDKSGLAGRRICQFDNADNCIDQATFGGFGSALAYTGFDGVFMGVPDRGPFDGRTDVPYRDRVHYLHLALDTAAAFPNIRTTLLDTVFLRATGDTDLVGSSADVENRFDPEGAAVSRSGSVFISDEYGPAILEFNLQGHLLRRIALPEKFLIANPSGDVDDDGNSLELYPANNTSGRQANRGMEGLAISPDGRYLFGLMQNALIQDNGLNASEPPGRRGFASRLLRVDLHTGATAEYVYLVDAINQGRGVNDILAINDHEFLVVERDNRSLVPTPPNAAQTPNFKKIYKIDLTGASDVSAVASLPETGAGLAALNIVPVTKSVFIDLLDPGYMVSATQTIRQVIAEKIEGLAWGPDLPDGRHVLYVISDNDLFPGRPTQIFAFAIDAEDADIDVALPQLSGPMFPPGQVRKALAQQ